MDCRRNLIRTATIDPGGWDSGTRRSIIYTIFLLAIGNSRSLSCQSAPMSQFIGPHRVRHFNRRFRSPDNWRLRHCPTYILYAVRFPVIDWLVNLSSNSPDAEQHFRPKDGSPVISYPSAGSVSRTRRMDIVSRVCRLYGRFSRFY